MTNPPAPAPNHGHPLERDPERLERIVDVMWAEIHKVLHRFPPRRIRSGSPNLAGIIGQTSAEMTFQGGDSPEDILSKALAALLLTPEHELKLAWEALAVRIAQNKAKGSLRAGEAGLRATKHRQALKLVSAEIHGPPDTGAQETDTLLNILADPNADTEAEFFATAQQLELLRLARELPDSRDREIFIGLHFQARTRKSLAEQFGLTSPGVVHIYRRTARQLYDHPRFQRFTEEEPQ